MKKNVVAVLMFLLFSSLRVQAGTSIIWFFSWGMYPQGTTGAGLTASTPAGIAQNSAVLWQLVLAGGNNAPDIVDSDNGANGYVSGDDIVLDSRTTPMGGDSIIDQQLFEYNGALPAFTSTTLYSGTNVYIRVFQDTTPTIGEYYYNSPTVAALDRASLPPQGVDGNNSTAHGDAPNIEIIAVPEPSTVALMLAGLAMVGYRRFRRA